MADMRTRIESELEVNTYLQNLRYALEHNARLISRLNEKSTKIEMCDIRISLLLQIYSQMKTL